MASETGDSAAPVIEKPLETSDKPSSIIDISEGVNQLVQGKRHMLVQDYVSAVSSLEKACKLFADNYGETASECGEPYLYYGKALLELSRMETGVLGHALQGVESEEDDDEEEDAEDDDKDSKDSDEQVENPDNVTGEERDLIVKQVGEALLENACELQKMVEELKSGKPTTSSENQVEAMDESKKDEAVTEETHSKSEDHLSKHVKPEVSNDAAEMTGETSSVQKCEEKSEAIKNSTEAEKKPLVTEDNGDSEKLTDKVDGVHGDVPDVPADNPDTTTKPDEVKVPTNEAIPKPEETKTEVPTNEAIPKPEETKTEVPTNEAIPKPEETKTEVPSKEVIPKSSNDNEEVPTEVPAEEDIPKSSNDGKEELATVPDKEDVPKPDEKADVPTDEVIPKSDSEEAKVTSSVDPTVDDKVETTEMAVDTKVPQEKEKPVPESKNDVEKPEFLEEAPITNNKIDEKSMDEEEPMDTGDDPESKMQESQKDENDDDEGDESESTGEKSQDEMAVGDADATAGPSNSTEEPKDKEDDVTNLQLAWEVLELAKVIFDRQAEKDEKLRLKSAEVLLKLGEVSIESENYTQAIEDLNSCLDIQKKVLTTDDRAVAETYYQLGLAFSLDNQYDNAVENFTNAIRVLEEKIANCRLAIEQGSTQTKDDSDPTVEDPVEVAKRELEELEALLPDIKTKIEDTEDMKKNAAEALKEAALSRLQETSSTSEMAAATSSPQASPSKPTRDVSHLVKRKRKPEEDIVSDSKDEIKKAKSEIDGKVDQITNGTTLNGSQKVEIPVGNAS